MLNMMNVITLALQDAESPAISAAGDAIADAANTAADAAPAVEQAAQGSSFGGIVILLLFVAAIIGGFLVANAMKLTDWGFRFAVCFFALVLGVSPFLGNLLRGDKVSDNIRYGIDLAGGTTMVFQVVEEEGKPLTNEIMDRMVGAVSKRINPTGTEEIRVVQIGSDRLEVTVPGKDPETVAAIKRRITELGELEFYVLAHPQQESEIVRQAMELPITTKALTRANSDGDQVVIAQWLPAFVKGSPPEPKLLRGGMDIIRRPINATIEIDGKRVQYESEEYLVLVRPDIMRVSGKFLRRAQAATDPEDGGQIVRFFFDNRGASRFRSLTTEFRPQPGKPTRQLGIALNNQLYSAPSINSIISDNGYIEGDFTAEETSELASILNAGALAVPIDRKPLSENTMDPTLGEDVRQKGVTAILIAAIAVVVFMLFYYRFAGIVAVICLILNLLLVLSIMATVATFTLPGLAGLVLTIGMAVDANVLIFERMREEINKGSSLRMAISNGFGKAFTTIVDANVTTLITAVILYMIGTDLVKGFAVSLFIGIIFSMFTSLYVGRLIFDVAEAKGWIRKLNMSSIVGTTNWNFLGKRGICAVLSLVLVIGGLSAFGSRGDNNYDIDFTGGTMVTFQLTEGAATEDVSAALKSQFEDGFTLERLTIAGEDGDAKHFRLRTTLSDSGDAKAEDSESLTAEERVRKRVNKSFADNSELNLLRVSVTPGEVAPFTIEEGDVSADAIEYARFNGGSTGTFKLSTEVGLGTLRDSISDELARIKVNGVSKYEDPTDFFMVQGTSGSGMNNDGQSVVKFDEALVRVTPDISAEDLTAALGTMKDTFASRPLFDEINTFSSAIAGEMKNSAIFAIIVSLIAIVAYIWFRFQKITFGLAAVVALVHDVLIVLGMTALMSYLSGNSIGQALLLNDFRINLPMVAAFLTIVGYSLNDTIVVFDRIREVRGKNPNLTTEIVNKSLNQTLSRTLLTSLTTFLVVIILYVMGGEGIHGFAFCLTLGVIVGTYSSIYVASPVLVWLMNRGTKAA